MKYLVSLINNEHGIFFNRFIEANNIDEVINKTYDIVTIQASIINIIPVTDTRTITKEILDKNFEIDKEYKDKYLKDTSLIPYIVRRDNNKWHLLYNKNNNELWIEDDPLIKIKTVDDLYVVLRLSNIAKEII